LKLKIGEAEYDVEPITPDLSPFLTRYGELAKTQPKSLEEAKKLQEEIREAVDVLLKENVKPDPPKEHRLQALQTVINLTKQVMDEAECFRKSKRPGD